MAMADEEKHWPGITLSVDVSHHREDNEAAKARRRRKLYGCYAARQFRGDKLASERTYWDHAAVLRQADLLKIGG